MNKRLFVAGLPFNSTTDEIKALFAQMGTVVSANIITDKFTGQSKGFGFVEMTTDEEANTAIVKLNGTDFGGRKIVVAEAKPMEKRDFSSGGRPAFGQGGSRGGGGFGGKKQSFGRREGGRGSFGRNRDTRGGNKW